eukprot:m.2385 g.2385  ORF g.2385 m.2385 type:complete len:102 (-) comp1772_c0_seq1:312-617(-)
MSSLDRCSDEEKRHSDVEFVGQGIEMQPNVPLHNKIKNPKSCLTCKIVGTTSFAIAGSYLLYSRKSVSDKRTRALMAGFSGVMFTLAASRALWDPEQGSEE